MPELVPSLYEQTSDSQKYFIARVENTKILSYSVNSQSHNTVFSIRIVAISYTSSLTKSREMIVYKFGGATTRTARGLDTLVEIVRTAHVDELRRARRSSSLTGLVLVISAIGHTTRYLHRTAEASEQGNLIAASELIERIANQHEQLLAALKLPSSTALEVRAEFSKCTLEIRALSEGVNITRELSPRVRDTFLSYGERLAFTLITALLEERGIPIKAIDARELVVTNEEFNNAAPLLEETTERACELIIPKLEHSKVVVTQGFIGATRDGITTTMGSESSDLSATLLGRALGAREIVIWKSVQGIYSSDPELIPHAKLITNLSFAEAEEIGRRGAQVLHKATVQPLQTMEPKVLLRVAAPNAKSKRSSQIQLALGVNVRKPRPLALAVEKHLIPLKLERRFEGDAITGETLAIQVLSTKEKKERESSRRAIRRATFVWSTESEILLLAKKYLKTEIVRDLGTSEFRVTEQPPLCSISLVVRTPEGKSNYSALRQQMRRSLRQFNLYAFFQVEHSLVAILEESEVIPALRKLHRVFFGI
ncbi:MAG: hypothetical protein ABI444_04310 [Candidatus Kapaibacterium sp.]|jgi:aspartate kinase